MESISALAITLGHSFNDILLAPDETELLAKKIVLFELSVFPESRPNTEDPFHHETDSQDAKQSYHFVL